MIISVSITALLVHNFHRTLNFTAANMSTKIIVLLETEGVSPNDQAALLSDVQGSLSHILLLQGHFGRQRITIE